MKHRQRWTDLAELLCIDNLHGQQSIESSERYLLTASSRGCRWQGIVHNSDDAYWNARPQIRRGGKADEALRDAINHSEGPERNVRPGAELKDIERTSERAQSEPA